MTKLAVDKALIEQVIETLEGVCYAHGYQGGTPVAAVVALRAALEQPQTQPVTPYACPKCQALWLHWPSGQTGDDKDHLNCKSSKWCDYCEKAGLDQLERLERVPAALTAPPAEVPLLAEEVIGCFEAAECEGLQQVLEETTDENLKDLVQRRLMYAFYAAQAVRKKVGLKS